MSDIGIFFYGEDGLDWAEYLQAKFAEEEVLSCLEKVENGSDHKYIVNVLLATPSLLDDSSVQENIFSMNPLQSIVVLLGIEETDVTAHLIKGKCPDITQWEFYEMFPTEESVANLTQIVVKRSGKYDFLPAPRPSLTNESDDFLKFKPLVKVATAETEAGIDVLLLSNRKGSSDIDVEFTNPNYQEKTTAKFCDLATYILHVPDPSWFDCQQNFVQASEEKSISVQGTIPPVPLLKQMPSKQDVIRQILGFEEDPVPIACQCFNLSNDSDVEDDNGIFDNYLSSCLHEQSDTKASDSSTINKTDTKDASKFPTLLHFAAEHNLINLTNNLLKLPGSIVPCLTMNSDQETPQMIAQRHEFNEVSQAIKSLVKREKLLGKIPKLTDSGIIDDNKLETIFELHGTDKADKGLKKAKSGLLSRLIMPNIKKAKKKSTKDGTEMYGNIKSKSRSSSITSDSDDIVKFRASLSSASSAEHESGYYEQIKHDDPFDDDTNGKDQSLGKSIPLSKSARF